MAREPEAGRMINRGLDSTATAEEVGNHHWPTIANYYAQHGGTFPAHHSHPDLPEEWLQEIHDQTAFHGSMHDERAVYHEPKNIPGCWGRKRVTDTQPKKYVKKPVVVTAVRWNGTPEHFRLLHHDGWIQGTPDKPVIRTLEGVMHVSPGDWIIRGTRGELYPCKNDAFLDTFREA